ncbi:MAG TPA: gluconokinase [Chitinophagaceae bacterium]|jgi:carbohydrate kinase (thermoresistant glucokinase family)|nr:gluconokinase [Chitinophagaceae bacterium]
MSPIIIYIMGVSGSGKTTIGKKLSERTSIPFFDADDFHSPANKEKMRAGQPLTDDDRAEWLINMNELAKQQMKKNGAIIACSALKEKYRAILSKEIIVPVIWIFLNGNYELIQKRMNARTDHFMPPALLASQFEALETPQQAITIDISNEPDEIVDMIISRLTLKPS